MSLNQYEYYSLSSSTTISRNRGLFLLVIVGHLVSLKQSVLIPPLSQIGSQFWFLLESGLLLEDMVSSVFRIMLGLVISTSLAIVLGLIAAFWAASAGFMRILTTAMRRRRAFLMRSNTKQQRGNSHRLPTGTSLLNSTFILRRCCSRMMSPTKLPWFLMCKLPSKSPLIR